MHILVFKTDVKDETSVQLVSNLLSGNEHISRWTIDHWDIDKVLRVESHHDCSEEVIQKLTSAGLYCETLED